MYSKIGVAVASLLCMGHVAAMEEDGALWTGLSDLKLVASKILLEKLTVTEFNNIPDAYLIDGMPLRAYLRDTLFPRAWIPYEGEFSTADILNHPDNRGWNLLLSVDQKIKDYVLYEASRYQSIGLSFWQRHTAMVCAAAIGANCLQPIPGYENSVVVQFVEMNLYRIVDYLLQHSLMHSSDVLHRLLPYANTVTMARMLVEHGAHPLHFDSGRSLLLRVINNQLYQPELISYYAQLGVDVNQCLDDEGNTALHYLAEGVTNKLSFVQTAARKKAEAILENQGDIHKRNKCEIRPLDCALQAVDNQSEGFEIYFSRPQELWNFFHSQHLRQ